jgi:hypothetical protein
MHGSFNVSFRPMVHAYGELFFSMHVDALDKDLFAVIENPHFNESVRSVAINSVIPITIYFSTYEYLSGAPISIYEIF